jgi:hypothetical protein
MNWFLEDDESGFVGFRPPGRAEVRRLRALLQRLFRVAAKPLVSEGWIAHTSSLTFRHVPGNWGHITLGWEPTGSPTSFTLSAGTRSAHLTRVLERRDPDRLPSNRYLWLHAVVLWEYPLTFVHADAGRPAGPLVIPDRRDVFGLYDGVPREAIDDPSWRPGELNPGTASAWLRDALADLAPRVVHLLSDEAIRDWILNSPDDLTPYRLRRAALLSRHLGLAAELEAILARDRLAMVELERKSREADLEDSTVLGITPAEARRRRVPDVDWDRRFEPAMWSHGRFVEFLRSLDR